MKKDYFTSDKNIVLKPIDLSYFKPLEVKVRDDRRESFETAFKIFKSIVQKEGIIVKYKEKQQYEKPSIKKRRKRKEAQERKMAMEAKQKLIDSGEWEKRMKKKAQKRQERDDKRKEKGTYNE